MINKYLQNFIKSNTGLLIRFDDIAENMNWPLMKMCEDLLLEHNIKPVMGVIPNNQDKTLLNYPRNENFWETIRHWQSLGWKIAMHGYSHVYDRQTNKKDFFQHGGMSEFFGHSLEEQTDKLKKGLKIFEDQKIEIKIFFAPNHTYDSNTFIALKSCGITEVIDGHGIMPFKRFGIKFIPQLFYKNIILPFGIQSTQIHLNYWSDDDFIKFRKFIIKNISKIISHSEALNKVSDSKAYNFFNSIIKKFLLLKRTF